MWCPNCKSEFRPGITHCPDCGSPLVEEEPLTVDTAVVKSRIEAFEEHTAAETLHSLSDGSTAYVEKTIKYEDMKSTAYSFLFVGLLGFVLLALSLAGLLPLQFADYMKYLMTFVMGGLFLAFLIIGILSFRKLKTLKAQMATEQQNYSAAHGWFFDHYKARDLDQACNVNTDTDLQQRYFYRSTFIKKSLTQQFDYFEPAFTDYLVEKFYEELYPEES